MRFLLFLFLLLLLFVNGKFIVLGIGKERQKKKKKSFRYGYWKGIQKAIVVVRITEYICFMTSVVSESKKGPIDFHSQNLQQQQQHEGKEIQEYHRTLPLPSPCDADAFSLSADERQQLGLLVHDVLTGSGGGKERFSPGMGMLPSGGSPALHHRHPKEGGHARSTSPPLSGGNSGSENNSGGGRSSPASSSPFSGAASLLPSSFGRLRLAPPLLSVLAPGPTPIWYRVVTSALEGVREADTQERQAGVFHRKFQKELSAFHEDAKHREERERRQQRESRARLGSKLHYFTERYWKRRGELYQQAMRTEFQTFRQYYDRQKQEDMLAETEAITKTLVESMLGNRKRVSSLSSSSSIPVSAQKGEEEGVGTITQDAGKEVNGIRTTCGTEETANATPPTAASSLSSLPTGPSGMPPPLDLLDTLDGARPLRSYQCSALQWMIHLYENNLNGILADEMGLGKTVQTIALLCHYAQYHNDWGPHLVVVPTTVVLNWKEELQRWAPGLKVMVYMGSRKERQWCRKGWLAEDAFHVCITSYTLVVHDRAVFRRRPWGFLILDEAHQIKNFLSRKWQSLFDLNVEYRLLLTGTPLQNSMMELWSLFHFLLPSASAFRSNEEFKEWFSNPLEDMVAGRSALNESIVRRLQGLLRPFILRRLKRDVESQLPTKTEHVVRCRLSRRQRALYDEYMRRKETRRKFEEGGGVFSVLLALRKVCNHPDLFAERSTISPFVCDRSSAVVVKVPRLVLLQDQTFQYRFPTFDASSRGKRWTVEVWDLHEEREGAGWREGEKWGGETEEEEEEGGADDEEEEAGEWGGRKRRRTRRGGVVARTEDFPPRPPPRRLFRSESTRHGLHTDEKSGRNASSSPFDWLPCTWLQLDIRWGEHPPMDSLSPNLSTPSASVSCSSVPSFYASSVSSSGSFFLSSTGVSDYQIQRYDPKHLPFHVSSLDTGEGKRWSCGASARLSYPFLDTEASVPRRGEGVQEVDTEEEPKKKAMTPHRLPLSSTLLHMLTSSCASTVEHVIGQRRRWTYACQSLRQKEMATRTVYLSYPRWVHDVVAESTSPGLPARGGRKRKEDCLPNPPHTDGRTDHSSRRRDEANEDGTSEARPRLAASRAALDWRGGWWERQGGHLLSPSALSCLSASFPDLFQSVAFRVSHTLLPLAPHVAVVVPNAIPSKAPCLVCAFPLRRPQCFQCTAQMCAPLIAWTRREAERLQRCVAASRESIAVDGGRGGGGERTPRASVYDGAHFLAEWWPLQVRRCFCFPDRDLLIHDCGKLQYLKEKLVLLRTEGHRALVFTQFVKMLDVLEKFLALIGVAYLRLDGATRVEQRQLFVNRFNSDDRITVMILSTRSGGIGLNLTGADTVIFYDSDWNPTMDLQAQDRCHRIGQTRPVTVYRLISAHTVEESILEKARERKKLNNVVIRGGRFHAIANVVASSGGTTTEGGEGEPSAVVEEEDVNEDASAAAWAMLSMKTNLRAFFHDMDEDVELPHDRRRPSSPEEEDASDVEEEGKKMEMVPKEADAKDTANEGGSATKTLLTDGFSDVLEEMKQAEDAEDRDALEQVEAEIQARQREDEMTEEEDDEEDHAAEEAGVKRRREWEEEDRGRDSSVDADPPRYTDRQEAEMRATTEDIAFDTTRGGAAAAARHPDRSGERREDCDANGMRVGGKDSDPNVLPKTSPHEESEKEVCAPWGKEKDSRTSIPGSAPTHTTTTTTNSVFSQSWQEDWDEAKKSGQAHWFPPGESGSKVLLTHTEGSDAEEVEMQEEKERRCASTARCYLYEKEPALKKTAERRQRAFLQQRMRSDVDRQLTRHFAAYRPDMAEAFYDTLCQELEERSYQEDAEMPPFRRCLA